MSKYTMEGITNQLNDHLDNRSLYEELYKKCKLDYERTLAELEAAKKRIKELTEQLKAQFENEQDQCQLSQRND